MLGGGRCGGAPPAPWADSSMRGCISWEDVRRGRDISYISYISYISCVSYSEPLRDTGAH
ncbi:hypothetical protein EYF80_026925 [Liparis tanakae]|uniref:Uncharacterized protein n=1 Tax=Liparis tanakae TaxID=230148 RepID=A0A4Z2HBE6_9TELE|nr:hypothetical protein EYF80_026925 [Liparis tanakae]